MTRDDDEAEMEFEAPGQPAVELLLAGAEANSVRECVDRLDGGQKQAIALAFYQGLSLWRGLAFTGFALAFALAMLTPRPERPFESVVIVLAGPDAKPALVATGERAGRYLTVKAVAPVEVPPGRALELWMLPDGRGPVSMGLVPASGIDQLVLRAPVSVALQDIPALAVSIEPAGGSPTGAPTGPVVYTGRVERIYQN